MNINFKLFTSSAYNFVQQSIIKPLTEQQKKIALVVAAALGFLAACYLINRCCLKGNHLVDAQPQEKGQPKVQLPGEGQVKDNPDAADQKHEEQVKEDPAGQADHKAASPKDEKLEAKDEEKKGDQPLEEELEPSDPHQKVASPKAEKLEAKDEGKKGDQPVEEEQQPNDQPELPVEQPTSEPRAADEKPAEEEPVKSPDKTDDPKLTLAQTAKIVDLQAGFMVQAIDQMVLEKADTLSQVDKDQLAALKDQELKKKNIAQSLLDLEQREITRLKDQLKYESQRLDEEQVKLDKHLKKIKEHEEKIVAKENSINSLGDKIANLSRGEHETVIKNISYGPEDVVEKDGEKYKAKEFVGKLAHYIKIGKGFHLVSEVEASAYDLTEYKQLAVMKGAQYTLWQRTSSGYSDYVYGFLTEWKGDGVLPRIEIVWRSSNADFNEASIINADADLRRTRRDVDELKKDLLSLQEDQKRREDNITRIQDSIARAKASLQEKGEPT